MGQSLPLRLGLWLLLLLLLMPQAGSKHHNAYMNQLLAYHKAAVSWMTKVLGHPEDWLLAKDTAALMELDPLGKVLLGEAGGSRRLGPVLAVPPDMLKQWQGDRRLEAQRGKVHVQETDNMGLYCIPGIAVYTQPVIMCNGVLQTAAKYAALSALEASRCNVTGHQTCVCAKDSLYYMGDQCSLMRPLKCNPVLEDPVLDCPPPSPADGLGDPACFTIDRTQTVRFKFRLKCFLDGEVHTVDPNDPSKEVIMSELSVADLAQVTGTPYLSVDGRHYGLPDWYRDHFSYYLASGDLSLAVSFPFTAQLPRHISMKIWDFIRLSDDSHKQYKPIRSEHLLGTDVVAFDVDFAMVEDAFLVGGRAYLETAFDSHRGSHRLFVDIHNYLARHAASSGFSPWLIVAIVLPSVSALGCCSFLMIRFFRRWKRQKAKKAKALARAQAKAD